MPPPTGLGRARREPQLARGGQQRVEERRGALVPLGLAPSTGVSDQCVNSVPCDAASKVM